MLIDDGYSRRIGKYLIRPLVAAERRLLKQLIAEGLTWEAERFLFRKGRVTSIIGEEVIPEEEDEQEIAEALVTWPAESEDIKNLRKAAAIMMKSPLLGLRTCEMCRKWWFDNDTNKVVRIGDQNIRRPPYSPVACDTPVGCAKGHWSNPVAAFNEKNQRAWEHWLEWRAVGCPNPHDAILRRNWKWLEALAAHYGLGKNSRTVRK